MRVHLTLEVRVEVEESKMRNPETADISRSGRLLLWLCKRLGLGTVGLVLCRRDSRQVVALLVARDDSSLVAAARHVGASVHTAEMLALLETIQRREEEEEEEETPRVVH